MTYKVCYWDSDLQKQLERDATEDEALEIDARKVPDPARFQAQIVQAAQDLLDNFAKTRGYDGILSACSYAASPTAKFSSEGQYCLSARDSVWGTLTTFLGAVESGSASMPSTVDEVLATLPELSWPE